MRTGWIVLLGMATYGCGLTESGGDGPDGEGSGGAVATGGREGTGGNTSIGGPFGGGSGETGGQVGTGGSGETGGQVGTGGAGTGGDGACSLVKTVTQSLFLRNQSDVDALANVSRFEGNLYVTDDATDLSPLACLTEVTGEFGVFEAKSLKSLAGLDNLRTVRGLLAIGHFCTVKQADCIGNPVLEDVSALRNLNWAKKILVHPKCDEDEGGLSNCSMNAALRTLSFDSLLETGDIDLTMNPRLAEAHFDSLLIATSLTATSNEKLKTLTSATATAIGEIRIFGSPGLDELTMPELVHSDLIDIGFTALTDFRGLGRIESIGVLDLTHNAELESLDGFEQLRTAESLHLGSSKALESIAALRSLESVGESLYLFSNPLLASLDGLENLKHVGGLTIAYQTSLKGIEALGSLETAPGGLSIYGNNLLASLEGLGQIKTTRYLNISHNAILPNLIGVEAFESVTHLSIEANPLLPTCEAERFRDSIAIQESATIINNDDAGTCEP